MLIDKAFSLQSQFRNLEILTKSETKPKVRGKKCLQLLILSFSTKKMSIKENVITLEPFELSTQGH